MMQTTMMQYPLTLAHLLDRAGKYYGATEIVSRLPDKSLHRHTYKDFYRRSRALAGALQKAGLRKGERVATLMWNHYVHLEAYFGIPAAGGVLHTLNLRLAPQDIAFIVNHARDRFLIVDDVLLPLLEKFANTINVERIFVVPLTGKPVPAPYENYETFLDTAPAMSSYPDPDENDPCGMCYTSGTTGSPKGVVYSHRSTVLHALVSSTPNCLNIGSSDVVSPVVPMFHANAWALPYISVLTGAKQVFPGPHLDSHSLLDLYERERVTLTGGVPTIWLTLLQALNEHPAKYKLFPSMRMVVGGSAVPESLIRSFAKHDLHITQAWGMTETSPIATVSTLKANMTGLPADARFALRARQGMAMPFVDMRLIGDEGEMPWDGSSVGEVQVRGPWVTGQYHDLPAEAGSFTSDGWLRTGDVGSIDAEGFLKLSDRTKDLIKSGGEWISSVDLENAIMGHPAVQEAAVIAVPHVKWSERPLAVIVLRSGAEADAAAIREHLAQKFAKWQLPDAYVFVDEIPRTSTGKFLKTRIREQYRDWKWE